MNFYSGNGSALSTNAAGIPNNFGIGLVGTSSGNVVEKNKVGGNVNGVYVAATAGSGGSNTIRHNIFAGNPPALVSQVPGAHQGADIQNLSPAGTNSFDENYCLTYAGAGTSPCPNLTRHGGEHEDADKNGEH